MTSRPRTRAFTKTTMGAASSRLRSSNAMNETSYVKTAAKIGTCILCGGIFGVATEKGKDHQWEELNWTELYITCNLTVQCPGLMCVQIGAGTHNAGYTCLGIFIGAVIYGIVEPYISDLTKPKSALKVQFLNQWHESPYFVLSLPVAAMIGLGVFSLELFYPSSQELGQDLSATTGDTLMSAPAWPPFFCGCLVGILQIPLVLVMKDTLGGSSFYCTLVSQGLVTEKLKRLSPYLVKFQKGFENWWQVPFFGGALAGSMLSAISSGTYGTVAGVSPMTAVAGGFLIIFGARLANGCTSGHGLSGFGLLNILSMTATVSMFAGGMVTAFASKYML